MKKFALAIVALGALIFAAPSVADAQTVVIKRGGHHAGHHHPGARAHYRSHRGSHRGWHRGHGHRSKVVIIKKRRY